MRVLERSRARSVAVLGAAALLTAGLVGCSSDNGDTSEGTETAATRTFEAQNGSIEIPADPQRIVACGYAAFPLIQSGANLAAVCEWTREIDSMDDETLAAYEALPKVAPDGAASELNYEAITAAEPDLIIMGVPARVQSQVDMAKLEALAPVVFLGPTNPGDWRDLGEQYADAANVADTYGDSKSQYEARAAEIADKYAGTLGSLKFAGLCSTCGTEPGEFFREYKSSYTTNLFDDLGFTFPGEPVDPADVHGEYVSLEQLPQNLADADVIVYGLEADGSVSAELQEVFDSPLWQNLPAVKAGNLVGVQHANAATYETALLALDSIDSGLEKLPANQKQ
ncbi:ABC transporter substrate-binding protein [Rhodococcus coprophilus]|uniref:ABC transporter substrate-binding protein n=1 Tax=Rhodococcus coprophilus TaxID=38310 RepID=A0A2X4WXE3_9NOCA|nr:ABC transporter substrate-binding protein [Rhodococcus coprophilus]MBM7458206.1 iron complex transport system substrate-binding protein [Rhodococcus coprophilus]SQI31685.1 ABC transporter substrate-binding protein [Rhodococcus coprophilus]